MKVTTVGLDLAKQATRRSIRIEKEVSPATDCEAFTDDGTVQSRRRRSCSNRKTLDVG